MSAIASAFSFSVCTMPFCPWMGQFFRLLRSFQIAFRSPSSSSDTNMFFRVLPHRSNLWLSSAGLISEVKLRASS